MKEDKLLAAGLGVFRVEWKESHGGGSSVASIYMDREGTRMLAPANWCGPGKLLEQRKAIKALIKLGGPGES
jgi:hypothetical protein